jgi:hypothetical protein
LNEIRAEKKSFGRSGAKLDPCIHAKPIARLVLLVRTIRDFVSVYETQGFRCHQFSLLSDDDTICCRMLATKRDFIVFGPFHRQIVNFCPKTRMYVDTSEVMRKSGG